MGRGLGPVQRRIMELLETTPPRSRFSQYPHRARAGWSVEQLADALALSPRRTRAAVTALTDRDLVFPTHDAVSERGEGYSSVTAYGLVVWTMDQARDWHSDELAQRERDRANAARRAALSVPESALAVGKYE